MANVLLSPDQVNYLQAASRPFAMPNQLQTAAPEQPAQPSLDTVSPQQAVPAAAVAPPPPPPATPTGPPTANGFDGVSDTFASFLKTNKIASMDDFKNGSFARRKRLLDQYSNTDAFRTTVQNGGGTTDGDMVSARIEFKRRFLGGTPPEELGIHTAANPIIAIGRGATGMTKSLSDVFGAGNVVSEKLDAANKWLTSKMSAGQQELDKQKAEEMNMATSETERAGIALKYAAKSPVTSLGDATGSILPLAASLLAGPAAAPVAAGMAIASGVGSVKGSIYETLKNAKPEVLMSDPYYATMISSGMPEAKAREILATARQTYANAPAEIAFGGVIAGIASRMGATGEVTKLLTKQMVLQQARVTIANKGLVGTMKAGGVEMVTEATEGGTQRLAANRAAGAEGAGVKWNEGLGEEIGGVLVGSAGLGAGTRAMSNRKAGQIVAARDAEDRAAKRANQAEQDSFDLKNQAEGVRMRKEQADAVRATEEAFYANAPEATRPGFQQRFESALTKATNVLTKEDSQYEPVGENMGERIADARTALQDELATLKSVYGGEKDTTQFERKSKRISDALDEIDRTSQAFNRASTVQSPEPSPTPTPEASKDNLFPNATADAAVLFEQRYTAAINVARNALGALGSTDAVDGKSIHERIVDTRSKLEAAQTTLSEVYNGQPEHKEFLKQNRKYIAALEAIDSAVGSYTTLGETSQQQSNVEENDAAETAALHAQLIELYPKDYERLSKLSAYDVSQQAQAWLQDHYGDEDFAYLKGEVNSLPAELRTSMWVDALADAMGARREVDPEVATETFVASVSTNTPNITQYGAPNAAPNPVLATKLNEVGLPDAGEVDAVAAAQAALKAVYSDKEYTQLSDLITDLPEDMQAGEWISAALDAAKGTKRMFYQKAEGEIQVPSAKDSMDRYKAVNTALSAAIGMDIRRVPQVRVMTYELGAQIAKLRGASAMNSLGFMNPATGEIYINSWATPPQQAFGVLLHEVAHKRLYLDMGPAEVQALYDQVQTWAQSPVGSIERTVYDRAAANIAKYDPAEQSSEWLPMVVGYAAWEMGVSGIAPEAAPNTGVASWMEQFRQWIMQKLANFGLVKTEPLSAQDLMAVADGLLKHEVENKGTPREELHKLRALLDSDTKLYAMKSEQATPGRGVKRVVDYAEAVDMKDQTRAVASRGPDGTWTMTQDGEVTVLPSFDALMDAFSDAGLRYTYRAKNSGVTVTTVSRELDLNPYLAPSIEKALTAGIGAEAVGKITGILRTLEFRYVNKFEGLDRLDSLRGIKRGDIGSLVDRWQTDKSKIDAELLTPGLGTDSIATTLMDAQKALKDKNVSPQLIASYWYAINAKDRHAHLSGKGPFLDANGKEKTTFTGLQFDGRVDDDGALTLASDDVVSRLADLQAISEYMRKGEQLTSEAEYRSGIIDKATFEDRKRRDFMYAPFRTYNPEKSLSSMESATGRSSMADDPWVMHQATMAARMARAMQNETRTAIAEAVKSNMSQGMSDIIKPIGELQLDRKAVTADVPAEWVPVRREKDVITYYVDGKPYGLKIEDPNLKKAMEFTEPDALLRFVGTLKNFYQGTLTRWNPAFLLKAAGWDFITAYGNAQGAFGTQNVPNKRAAAFARSVITNAIQMMPSSFKRGTLGSVDNEFLQLFIASGGELSFKDRYADNRAALSDNVAPSGPLMVAGGTLKDKAVGSLKKVEGALNTVEEAVRAGGFKSYLELKYGKPFESPEALKEWALANPGIIQQAAIGSKRLITNFEQTGNAQGLRTWMLFFNPAMQGAFSMIPSILRSSHGRKTALILGTLALLTGAAADEEDKDVDDKNMITRRKGYGDRLFIGAHSVDLPPEFRPFVAMGYAAAGVMRGHLDAGEAIHLVANRVVDTLSPFRITHEGAGGLDIGNRIAYTVAGPLQILGPAVTGKDYFGRPLESTAGMRKGDEKTKADFMKGRSSDSAYAQRVAEWAFENTDGAVDVSPGMADAAMRQIGGGWANFVLGIEKEMGEGKNLADALSKKLLSSYQTEHNKYGARAEYEDAYNKENSRLRAAVERGFTPAEGLDLLKAKNNAVSVPREEIDSVSVGGFKLSKLRTMYREAKAAGNLDALPLLREQIEIGTLMQNQLMGRALIEYNKLK